MNYFIAGPRKGIQAKTVCSCIPRSQIPGSGFPIFCQWNVDSALLKLYSGFRRLGLELHRRDFSDSIPDPKSKNFIFHEAYFMSNNESKELRAIYTRKNRTRLT